MSGTYAERAKAHIAEIRAILRQSRFRAEREFNALPSDEREDIFKLADLNQSDSDPRYFLRGSRFHEFNETGRRKIIGAIRRMRKIGKRFDGVLPSESTKVDWSLIPNSTNEENH